MASLSLPPTIDRRHPILTQEYAIYTPPMDEMISTIGDWIDQHISGGCIYGPSRFGKSRGIKWHLKDVLEERFSRFVPLVIWIRPPGYKSEAEFWNLLLHSTKFYFAKTFNQKKKQDARFLFKQQLITMAKKALGRYVVLLVDEAQDVTLNEWQWLLGLQNELDYEGYRFSVFSIGSQQMMFQPDYIARTGNAHIAARFFVRDARFYGIRSVDELKYVLNGYDLDSEWPFESEISYLNYFAPEYFAKGQRLSNHADIIWQSFVAEIPPAIKARNRKTYPEVPMQHVAQLVEWILQQLANGLIWDEAMSETCLVNEIRKNRFSAHLTMVSGKE